MRAELDDVAFSVVRRGYDRAQVEESLTRLTAQLDATAAARDAAVEEVRTLTRQLDTSRSETQAVRTASGESRNEVLKLRGQVADLSTIPSTVDGMSERLQQMVRIAQDEVNDMRSRGTASATQVLTMAQAEADELRDRSLKERREFEAERQAAEESLRGQLAESQSRLDQLRNDSDGQRARLEAEFEERRAKAEEEFAAEMAERRAALLAELDAQEARHRAEATRIVDAAAHEARTRVADATTEAHRLQTDARNDIGAAQRDLEELRSLQHQVSEQLTSVRALLDWTLPKIGVPAPREPARGMPEGVPTPPVAVAPLPVAEAPEIRSVAAVPGDTTTVEPEQASTGDEQDPRNSGPDRPTPIARHSRTSTPPGRVGAPR